MKESFRISIIEDLVMLTLLTIFISLHSLSQCFLLDAFGIENTTDTDTDIPQEGTLDENFNNVVEKNEINSFGNKMEEEEKPQHLPIFVVLRQSGTSNRKGDTSTSIRDGLLRFN